LHHHSLESLEPTCTATGVQLANRKRAVAAIWTTVIALSDFMFVFLACPGPRSAHV
jgi:hypothetical protein